MKSLLTIVILSGMFVFACMSGFVELNKLSFATSIMPSFFRVFIVSFDEDKITYSPHGTYNGKRNRYDRDGYYSSCLETGAPVLNSIPSFDMRSREINC